LRVSLFRIRTSLIDGAPVLFPRHGTHKNRDAKTEEHHQWKVLVWKIHVFTCFFPFLIQSQFHTNSPAFSMAQESFQSGRHSTTLPNPSALLLHLTSAVSNAAPSAARSAR
jgi:hypothetical protein